MGDAVIKGNLIAQTLETGSLWDVSEMNNKSWDTNLLFYHGHQVVTNPVFVKTVVVENLLTSFNDPTFKGLFIGVFQVLGD